MAATCVIGIDIGSQETTMVAADGEIIRTSTGSIAYPSLVSFAGKERFIGETALQHVSSNAENTITNIPNLYGKSLEEWQQQPVCIHTRFACEDAGSGLVCVRVQFNGEPTLVHSTHILSMWLKHLYEQASSVYSGDISVALSAPSVLLPAQRAAINDAAHLAGINSIKIVDSIAAITELYKTKHALDEGELDRTVCVIEMGHTQTTVFVFKLTPEGISIKSQSYDSHLGGVNFDAQLFEHLAAICKERYGVDIVPRTKRGARLFTACEKIRKVLSTIPETRQQVENLTDAGDVTLPVTREDLASICAPLLQRFTALLEDALAKAAPEVDIQSIHVELLGGCTRMPAVRDAITHVFATRGHVNVVLGAKLDDVSIARGAAIVFKETLAACTGQDAVPMSVEGEQLPTPQSEGLLSESELESLICFEDRIASLDAEAKACAGVRNELESLVLELRAAMRGHAHRDKLDASVVSPLLQQCEDWLYSEEATEGSLEVLRTRKEELETLVKGACEEFYAAVESSKAETEKQLEEESKKFAAENEDEDTNELRDSRIRKPERIKLVSKNKDEGTELFKAGNFRLAAARYHKALTHSAKLFDLSPDEASLVSSLKLSLHLNLAQCYLKLQNWEQTIRNCNDALDIDPNTSKAFFRRATAYESMKDYEKALVDVRQCLLLTPDDAGVAKMNTRVQAAINKQKEKEKNMWGRAFNAK